ncbi:hypothetical protein [Aeromonas veronii]|uniref:hypothetical protein n=1 Tax=Aeromonas veronii TaxID=654 RepID=UPI003B9F37F3
MTGEMLRFCGSHGTSRSKANQILKVGFVKAEGRHGTGVYFWSKSDPDTFNLGTQKALAWAELCKRQGRYKSDTDDTPRCITATISVDKSRFLDVRSDPVCRMLEQFVHRCADVFKGSNTSSKVRSGSQILDAFVAELESLNKQKFEVLHDHTELPSAYKQTLKRRLGYNDDQMRVAKLDQAGCYVVRCLGCLSDLKEDIV